MPPIDHLSIPDLFLRRPAVEANPLPDRTLLLFHSERSIAVPLNESAAEIWRMCDGAHTVGQIVDALAETYDQERNRIEQDARMFLDELLQLELVERVPAPA